MFASNSKKDQTIFKIYMKKYLLFLLALFCFYTSFAQKAVKVTFEEIKAQCKDVPFEKRLRVTVPRFSVTTSNAPYEFGGNLATMLTNALQEVNCYRVLESLKNSDDMDDEINRGEGRYANKKSAPKAGKQLGAQVVITGEITEYNVKSTGVGVAVFKIGSNKAKIGFILKMVNPETREVLFSKSINVEAKTGGATSIGLFGANLVSSQQSDPAVANACEQGIIQAVEFLASKKDILQLPSNSTDKASSTAVNETEIVMTNANFSSFNAMATLLSQLSGFKSIEKKLSAGTANYTISHLGTADKLLSEIDKKIGSKYEVIGFDNGIIELKVK